VKLKKQNTKEANGKILNEAKRGCFSKLKLIKNLLEIIHVIREIERFGNFVNLE
jgi:hypothetical protein